MLVPVGTRFSVGGQSLIALVFQTGRPARIDDYTAAAGVTGTRIREAGIRATVGAPVSVEGFPGGLRRRCRPGDGRGDGRGAAAVRRAAFAGTPSGPPAWKTLPCWYLLGTQDKAIPPALQHFMAERASATIVEVPASHVGNRLSTG